MALIAGDIIDRAKLIAQPTGFTAGVSPTQLLAHLSNLDNDLTQAANQIAPALVSTAGDQITCKNSLNPLGYDLEPATGYTDFKYIDSNGNHREIHIVAEVDFLNPARHPAAMLAEGIGRYRCLVPADPLGMGWDGDSDRAYFREDDKITYRYIPLPTSLCSVDDTLRAPDFCVSYLTQACAALILQMLGAPPEQVQAAVMREQFYYRTLIMQMYKQARIDTPNQVSEKTFNYTVLTAR